MPCELIWEADRVTARFEGVVSTREFLGGALSVNADCRFDALRYIINDFTAIAGHELDLAQVSEDLAVAAVGAMMTNPKIRVVIVTTDAALIALDELLHSPAFACPHESYVFPTLASAHAWLREQQAEALFG